GSGPLVILVRNRQVPPARIRQTKGSDRPVEPNVFETANAGFAQIMYEEYLRDPAAVSEEWRRYFENGNAGLSQEQGNGHHPSVQPAASAEAPSRRAAEPPSMEPPSRRSAEPPPAPPGAVPITGPAARLVANMNESRGIPTATSFRELAVAQLETRRRELNNALRAAGRAEKVSFTHLIGYAIVRAADRHPALTTVYLEVDGAPHKLPGGRVNLGIAVDVERKDGSRGLVVPVIHDAARKSFAEFHQVYE